jgi:hypothetical protein
MIYGEPVIDMGVAAVYSSLVLSGIALGFVLGDRASSRSVRLVVGTVASAALVWLVGATMF